MLGLFDLRADWSHILRAWAWWCNCKHPRWSASWVQCDCAVFCKDVFLQSWVQQSAKSHGNMSRRKGCIWACYFKCRERFFWSQHALHIQPIYLFWAPQQGILTWMPHLSKALGKISEECLSSWCRCLLMEAPSQSRWDRQLLPQLSQLPLRHLWLTGMQWNASYLIVLPMQNMLIMTSILDVLCKDLLLVKLPDIRFHRRSQVQHLIKTHNFTYIHSYEAKSIWKYCIVSGDIFCPECWMIMH